MLHSARTIHAAILTGRVVDFAGRPVAGAEVRMWQKLPTANGPGVSDQPVRFDDGDVLVTDGEGRFTSPDVLVGEAMARIVAEANGTLAERSGWIEIPNGATVVAPKITLKRLRAVFGEARDREGRPVAGAIVFSSGDGHQRAQTKTGSGGKFFLDGVPEGPLFLFVEKPGYRFTGIRLPAGHSEAAFTLAAIEEAVKPLASLPSQLSKAEEIALAREVLDSWRRELRGGLDEEKFFFYAAVAAIDPLAALEDIDALGILARQYKLLARDGFLEIAVARAGELPADRLQALIESGDNKLGMVLPYVKASRHLQDNQRSRVLAYLEAALAHARRVGSQTYRASALAQTADAYFSIGDRKRAETVLAEAEGLAERLPEDGRLLDVYGFLALAAVYTDANRAVEWLEKMKADRDYPRRGAELAIRLLPKHAERAEEVWNRTSAGNYLPDSSDLLPLPWHARPYLPDFCYRLARIDRSRAERVADAAKQTALRLRGQGAIALALAEKEPQAARRVLEALVRQELPRIDDDAVSLYRWCSRPVTAAWLLPIAERGAPDLCREILWRSLAMRLQRPRYDHLDDAIELSDLRLARMLARYDRALARALVEPLASCAVRMTAAGGTDLKSPHAIQAASLATRFGRELAIAAAHVDARWGQGLIERMPYGRDGSKFHPIEYARQAFVWTLARHGVERWSEANEVCAGFWRPRAHGNGP